MIDSKHIGWAVLISTSVGQDKRTNTFLYTITKFEMFNQKQKTLNRMRYRAIRAFLRAIRDRILIGLGL